MGIPDSKMCLLPKSECNWFGGICVHLIVNLLKVISINESLTIIIRSTKNAFFSPSFHVNKILWTMLYWTIMRVMNKTEDND